MKFGCSIGIFLNSAHLICRSTDISQCSEGPFDFEITRVDCIHKSFNIYFYLSSIFTKQCNRQEAKRAAIKVAALLAHHSTTRQMKPQRKYRLGTASNNYWGFKPILRGPNLHPHLPLRFTQFSWLFGSH